MLSAKRCTKCGARYAHNLGLCPVCGHQEADRRSEEICAVCGASLKASQRVCPYCGASRAAPLHSSLPIIVRVFSSLAILALGAALVWWILPFGMGRDETPGASSIGMEIAQGAESSVTPAGHVVAPPLEMMSPVVTPDEPVGEGSSPDEHAPADLTPMLQEAMPTGSSVLAALPTDTAETTTPAADQGESLLPTGTATEVATATLVPTQGPSVHIVQQGDVLGRIAVQYDVSLSALIDANGLSEQSVLSIGDVIVIPTPVATPDATTEQVPAAATAAPTATPTAAAVASAGPLLHVVAAGDTLGALAVRYQVDSEDIAAENGISTNSVLRIGQELIVPGAIVASAATPTMEPTATPSATATPAATATLTALPTTTPIATPTVGVSSPRTLPVDSGTVAERIAPLDSAPGAGGAVGAGLLSQPTSASTARPTVTGGPTATPVATATPLPSPTPAPTLRVHTVQSGQHIGVIAAIYDLSMDDIASANGISISAILQVGQQLIIPGPEGSVAPATAEPATAVPTNAPVTAVVVTPEPGGSATPSPEIHVVQQGDTLGGIAVRYQVSSADIAQVNGLSLNAVLSIGQELVIPGVTAEPGPEATPTAPEATATLQAVATPTPFPYRTRPVTMSYRQPRLLLPINGAVIAGDETVPVLQWTSVGILKADEWYQVRLWTPDGGTEPVVYRTRATSLRLDADLYPESRRDDRFLWEVVVVHVPESQPGTHELSIISKQRAFRWR